MTLEDIKKIPNEVLTIAEVAPILGMAPSRLREELKNSPENMGFSIIKYGQQIRIPKRAFIKFMEGR